MRKSKVWYWDGDESGVILDRGFYLSGGLNEVKEQNTGQIDQICMYM